MRNTVFAIAFLLYIPVKGQITAAQSKALNQYADYANQSADEVNKIARSVITYYQSTFEQRSWSPAKFVCPVQPDEYYYNTAKAAANVVGSQSPEHKAFEKLRASAEAIDAKCKWLDTYHKLEDHKKDNHEAGRRTVQELAVLFDKYASDQQALSTTLDRTFRKAGSTSNKAKASDAMWTQLQRERNFLNQWKYNLKEELPDHWIIDQLKQSILETDEAIKSLKQTRLTLTYPASGMWSSFIESLGEILEIKRNALDGYNFDVSKTSKFQNDVYFSLMNYYNGALLSNYNTFLQYAANDKYYGLKAIKFVSLFRVNEAQANQAAKVTPFADIPRSEIKVPQSSSSISKPVFSALSNYVDLINETYRQVVHHRDVVRNMNASAANQFALKDFKGKGSLYFKHDHFKMPHSHFQKALNESKVLPPAIAKPLNDQAQVLMNILTEIDALGVAMEQEVSSKNYQQDGLTSLYEMIRRTVELFNIWDERKEVFFSDVLRVFDSYKPADPTSSWYKSGVALRNLTALDHEALFKAKAHYKETGPASVPTEGIDAALRKVIADEYENMKGIEKYGRNNGLCPYTPYEDLPKNSRNFSELLVELAPPKQTYDPYRHPYYSIVYIYNVIVDDYNKFCELSPAPHLKYVKQPELFVVIPPKPQQLPSQPGQPVARQTTPQNNSSTPVEPKQNTSPQTQEVRRDGATKLVRDTVYIEKRDTVYIHEFDDNVRSMEGYAINNMVLLLDVSGSMNAPDKLPLLKKSVLDMLSMMRQEDEISIIVFSGKPKTILEGVSFKDEDKIKKAINSLKPSGTTDGNAGIKLAYKVADANYIRGGNNRIVLATDGEFATGKETQDLITKFSKDDIFLTVFNFGSRNASSKNLERITTLGKGNYEFISKENVEIKLIREAKSKRAK